jgi:demethoxyubiquinone hydroxylase (CLK1/Coq7/Cat5 family)
MEVGPEAYIEDVEADVADAEVDDNLATARTIARILKVNHAGEHGAIRKRCAVLTLTA